MVSKNGPFTSMPYFDITVMSYFRFCPTFRIFGFSRAALKIVAMRWAFSVSRGTATYHAFPGAVAKLIPTNSASMGSTEVVSVSNAKKSFVIKILENSSASSSLSIRLYSTDPLLNASRRPSESIAWASAGKYSILGASFSSVS